ncbi:bifunctional riboflavin kinase/FAD synthetase [Planctomonas sp. JC2975]|uniref:bifunctional riboflavin kinase/FAD synthetase n=1 Tax=Planctomonas sp. JC2975 TaxID=2729626 RepID=UPI001474482C|nr:bifunctional riboflavin kinase/FAD synthetase [Planctomonas sp. JC2975]NNC13277.1 bifunctional riboflavin kinase/FAD synthetase [Planctomonas sp. JC2975]
MQVFRSIEDIPDDFGPSAVTVGKFDGVHLGHRAVIGRLLAVAHAQRLASVVVTFDRNPMSIVAPERCPEDLVSVEQKLELLEHTGIDAVLVLTFDLELSHVPAEDFVQRFLVSKLHTKTMLVGSDFRYGAKAAGDVALLRELGARDGYEVQLIDDVRPDGHDRVSSTWIRSLLAEGDVAYAGMLLGHPPTVRGVVVHGAQRGRELGFPTANLSPQCEGLIPADGVYAGWLVDGGVRHPAAISVGNNPTFEGVPQRQVEAYVIGEEIDLYDHIVGVEFAERIRGMVAFSGIEPLIRQMRTDVDEASRLLAEQ